MSAIKVYSAGLPVSAKEILTQAADEAYGKGVYDLIELDKANLRTTVRTIGRAATTALVVLDEESKETCSDIQNGLYNKECFYTYQDDITLVKELNQRLDTTLPIPTSENIYASVEDTGGISDSELESIRDSYEQKLTDKDAMIRNLSARIKELQDLVEDGGYVSEESEVVTNLKSQLEEARNKSETLDTENKNLRNQISDLNKAIENKESDNSKEKLENLQSKYNILEKAYKDQSKVISDIQVKASIQSGALTTKENRIKDLESRLAKYQKMEGELEDIDALKQGYENQINKLNAEVSAKRVTITGLEADKKTLQGIIDASRSDNDAAQQKADKYQEMYNNASNNVTKLEDQIGTLSGKVTSLESDRDSYKLKYENLKTDFSVKDQALQDQVDKNSDLLGENAKLRQQIEIVESSKNRNLDIELINSKNIELQEKLRELQGSVFQRISNTAMYSSPSNVAITRSFSNYKNLRFVFSASTDARKGTYKCLYSEFAQNSKNKYVLVDLVTETSVDYVAKIHDKIFPIKKWLVQGGGIQPYFTKTSLNNLHVMSTGLNYINESYLLTVDWERRFKELDNSGYIVYIYCGDLSGTVSRVMHESFVENVDKGNSFIYSSGSNLGLRNAYTNLRGITNLKKSTILVYDLINSKSTKNMVKYLSSLTECKILNKLSH